MQSVYVKEQEVAVNEEENLEKDYIQIFEMKEVQEVLGVKECILKNLAHQSLLKLE